MKPARLQAIYAAHPAVKALSDALTVGTQRTFRAGGLCASAAPLAFCGLFEAYKQARQYPFLFILDDADEAGYFYHDMIQIRGDDGIFFFPSSYRHAVKYGNRDDANVILRTQVLSRLAGGQLPLCIVTFPQAIAEKVVPGNELTARSLRLSRQQHAGITATEKRLNDFGFSKTDYVYEPGQYAVRGSIIDVFSFSSEMPFRIDFFGDEIESIRTFDIQTQLSADKQESALIVGRGMDQQTELVPITRLFPPDTVVVTKDIDYVGDAVTKVFADGFSASALTDVEITGATGTQQLPNAGELLVDGAELLKGLMPLRRIEFGAGTCTQASYVFSTTPQPAYHKNFDFVVTSFRDYTEKGYTLYILSDSVKQTDRLADILHNQAPDLEFTPVDKTLHAGFADHTLKACFFTDHQIFDRFHKFNLRSDKARSGKLALSLKELREFNIGDYVVHIDHGIGRFGGLVRIPLGNGKMQEAIKITYLDNADVFVSIHALHKVSKYKGREGEIPRLNKLGSGAWEHLKQRTKNKIKDIARDLIRLYAARQHSKGFAFSPDSFMQHELEASFLYEDTPDQLKATQAVKADMERSQPMDRLICGDVGFGKTEIAIRAAFKAAVDNKQTAVLVPTTVLAYQHFRTFTTRLKDMPVRVDYLSRARTTKQTKAILNDLANGNINIIIGTHKLIGKNVRFNDLGLLVIDEEQKFGVAVKERIRQMKTSVDTLTLTATPIPRTLQFSLMGARDLSVIQTPPPNRYPVHTEVHTFSDTLITEAINFEMARGGQVFLVNNRISGLYDLEKRIRRLVPDARLNVAHGQMPPDQLEHIILDFVNYDIDVLLSTTIIENGLDIPNANTIIIFNAHNFGLSDLHQMRGRVGRSNKKAFCYLIAPPLALLPPDARRRLQAIENFSDLGSGIHIALQDLDIRGAGNLLGAEQSGFIADLGYEAYQKILSQAVNELRTEEFAELYSNKPTDKTADYVNDCTLESDLPMSFSETYVPGSSERMLLYRELDSLQRDSDIDNFRHHMVDRFGPIPEEGEELIRVVTLRRLGKEVGAEKIFLKGGCMTIFFVDNPANPFYQSPTFDRIIAFAQVNAARCALKEKNGKRMMTIRNVASVKEAVEILNQMNLNQTTC